MFLSSLAISFFNCFLLASSKILWDGRAPRNFTSLQLDVSAEPYLTVVKGSRAASVYTTLMGREVTPTPLWHDRLEEHIPYPAVAVEQVLRTSIGNSSIFVPGGGNGRPQTGFRRTELIAQKRGSPANLIPVMETERTAFHFSILLDEWRPLDYIHEYQVVFIEPSDGSHVFGIQLGSPFTNPTGHLPTVNARYFKVLDHGLKILYQTPFTDETWHNFAVVVDWDKRTLQVFYSTNDNLLTAVTPVVPNPTVKEGDDGKGDFHFGVLKLPIVNANDPPEVRDNVVYYGIQEGTVEALMYSGVFVEDLTDGLSIGLKKTLKI